ncbi:MAG: glycosyltransferase [candidate division Zixibacteria bacterium]|nr:glycosyltransferase [candidate division Zixibacteria bacterium]MDH3938626.1 glycosyltransferase [candidate division Zixibacteria bacterium]MDH4032810.1 glycosyltransferase [candidate division Zixibacteria bacterium]
MRLMMIAMGGSNHTTKWATAMRDVGHEVMLVTFYPPTPIEGVDIRHLKCRTRPGMLLEIGRVRRLAQEFRPAIVHAHYASSCGFVAVRVGVRPLVLSVWGDDIIEFPHRSPLHRWIVKRAIIGSDFVSATSHMLAEETERLVGGAVKPRVIPFGVDLNRFTFSERPSRSTVHIGTVRWLTKKYGLEYLIRAFARLAATRDNLKLTIIGWGPLRPELEGLAGSLGIGDRVTFTGRLPNDEVARCFESFDLFVMPSVSRGETFGVAAVEAMASGLPVVASDIGGLPEVVADGLTGRLAPPGDVERLTAALEHYVDSEETRRRDGRLGRERVEKLFDWKQNVQMMSAFYAEILADPRWSLKP